ITVYTDGSCIDNGTTNAKCGAGIWFGPNDPRNSAVRIPGENQSNQIGELVAIIIAIQKTDQYTPLTIASDSRYAIDGLNLHLKNWEAKGWTEIANKPYFQRAAYLLRRRAAPTKFKWIKGHNGNEGNEEADKLANIGANKTNPDDLNLNVPDEFKIEGVQLQNITQALAYRAIKATQISKQKQRRATIINLDIIRHAIHNHSGKWLTDESIWTANKSDLLTNQFKQFIFRATHGSFKIGDYWNNIPGYEQRARCSACDDQNESMEHILTECPNNHQKEIWKLAKNLWPHKNKPWPNLSIGLILGCASITDKPPQQRNEPTSNERAKKTTPREHLLLKVLIAESASLIWAIRCDTTINGNSHPIETITQRWHNRIEKRLHNDVINARRKHAKQPLIQRVRETWNGTLKNESALPLDWVLTHEVLVGIKPAQVP
ncbi:ribonuclease H-like protein, partial [Hygrophoropsis aurantiaca]